MLNRRSLSFLFFANATVSISSPDKLTWIQFLWRLIKLKISVLKIRKHWGLKGKLLSIGESEPDETCPDCIPCIGYLFKDPVSS